MLQFVLNLQRAIPNITYEEQCLRDLLAALASKVRYTRGDVAHGYCVFVNKGRFRISYIVK